MNIKEGCKRIYILISFIWICFFSLLGILDKDIELFIFAIIPPILLYFIALWIIKGFEKP